MAKKVLRNNIALVLDDSGSMAGVARHALKVFNGWIDDVKRDADKFNQLTDVSLLFFGSQIQPKLVHCPHTQLQHISRYNPRQGSTRLFDGVDEAMDILDDTIPDRRYDDSFLVIVITDGEENASRKCISTIVQRMKYKQGLDNWTFVFMVPPGHRDKFCRDYAVSKDNVIEWKQTEEGIREVGLSTSAGFSHYYASRAAGQRSVQNFFVTTDLSSVTPSQVYRKLTDISADCKVFTVPKEAVIRDFVEQKTKRPYVVGSTYYQLMKPEKVQLNKGVLIMEKGKSYIWSGNQARQLIGLPPGADAKVDPGNHANYDVFVQSTSVNRKLPRGTKVIVVT